MDRMFNMKVSAVVSPRLNDGLNDSEAAPRAFDLVDEFVSALASELGISIDVIEGTLRDAPGDGLVVVFGSAGMADYPEVSSRAILINADRSRIPGCLEERGLVAAIEKHRYFQWKRNRKDERGFGLFGRKDVAARLGAEVGKVFSTERYGAISCDRYSSLPALLAAYLRAYFEA